MERKRKYIQLFSFCLLLPKVLMSPKIQRETPYYWVHRPFSSKTVSDGFFRGGCYELKQKWLEQQRSQLSVFRNKRIQSENRSKQERWKNRVEFRGQRTYTNKRKPERQNWQAGTVYTMPFQVSLPNTWCNQCMVKESDKKTHPDAETRATERNTPWPWNQS